MTTEFNYDQAHERNSNHIHHDDDSIEFGADVDANHVISFHKDNPPDFNKDPYEDEDLQAPISHRKESTLLNNSPLLKLIEEVDGERPKRKQAPHGLIITCIFLGILAVGALIVVGLGVLEKQETAPQKSATQQAEAEVFVPELERSWHSYEISPASVDVLINGVALKTMKLSPEYDENSGLPLVIQKSNMVSFYRDGYVPFSDMIEKDRDFDESPLNYELMGDDVYLHSKLIIKAPKNIKPGEGLIYINGKMYGTEEDIEVPCVSGFPYFIHVQQKGFGDHLHVVWPIRNAQEVVLPTLQLQSNANRMTALTVDIRKEYLTDNSFSLDIFAEDQHTTKPGLRHIAKGELIEIKLRKDGRYPLDLILDSTPFGSITVEPYMQLSSLGVATLKVDKKSTEGVTVCFRRASEAVCVNPKEENMIPSGKWEMVAYRTVDETKVWFKNAPYETLQADTEYILSVDAVDAEDQFSYNLTPQKSKKKRR